MQEETKQSRCIIINPIVMVYLLKVQIYKVKTICLNPQTDIYALRNTNITLKVQKFLNRLQSTYL